jgi:hypothetical protein
MHGFIIKISRYISNDFRYVEEINYQKGVKYGEYRKYNSFDKLV